MRSRHVGPIFFIVCFCVLFLGTFGFSQTVMKRQLEGQTGIVTFVKLENGTPVASWRLQQSITTRFRRTAGEGLPGGEVEEGQEDPHGTDADTRYKNLARENPSFFSDWTEVAPTYNDYHGQTTACTEVKVEEPNAVPPDVADGIAAFHAHILQTTGVHIDVLNYDPLRPLTSYLKEGHVNLQVINNIPYGSSLFTVVFPQRWHRHIDTLDRHPVILCGQGYTVDNNAMYRQWTPHLHMIKKVAASGKNSAFNSLILVISNTGGRESLGIHSNAMKDVQGFLDYTKDFIINERSDTAETIDLGLDTNRIVMSNGSRAGNTALIWGANPHRADYNVVAIHAFVPPIRIGSMLRLSFFTYPALNDVVRHAIGARGAYRYSYRDPFTGAILTPMEKAIRIGHTFTGQSTIEGIDDHSAYGLLFRPELVEELKTKRITISEGTHDSYMPMPYFIEFDNMLKQRGIRHATCIGYVYGHGHIVAKADPPWDEDTFEVHRTLAMLVKGYDIQPYNGHFRVFHMPAEMYFENGTRFGDTELRIDNNLLRQIQDIRPDYFPEGHSAHKLVFSATLPAKAVASLPFTIALIGESGKSWKIWARPEMGYHPIYSASGVFGEDSANKDQLEYGSEWVILHLDNGLPVGRYEWFFEYAGKEVPNRFTPVVTSEGICPKAVTEVIADELPCYGIRESCGTYFHAANGSNENLSFGVDFYHPLLLEPNSDPVFEPMKDITAFVGQELGFVLSAYDPDGDELVYDLRNRFGKFFGRDVRMNGLTGEVSTFLEAHDVGTYRLTAIARDGKGGVARESFVVSVRN